MSEKANDTQFYDHRITAVKSGDSWCDITVDKGGTLSIPKPPVTPKVGDTTRFYGRGFGYPVRGVDINGVQVYYQTERQYEENQRIEQLKRDANRQQEYAEHKEAFTARINALPPPLQKRLFQFRERSADFGWQFEGYELECAEIAARLAAACERRSDGTIAEWFEKFRALDYTAQVSICGPDTGWSGNMIGFGTRQGRLLVEHPDLVPKDHGALCVSVGCDGFKVCDANWSKYKAMK